MTGGELAVAVFAVLVVLFGLWRAAVETRQDERRAARFERAEQVAVVRHAGHYDGSADEFTSPPVALGYDWGAVAREKANDARILAECEEQGRQQIEQARRDVNTENALVRMRHAAGNGRDIISKWERDHAQPWAQSMDEIMEDAVSNEKVNRDLAERQGLAKAYRRS